MFPWELLAAVALTATATTTGVLGLDPTTNATKSFDYAQYCNGSTKSDSMVGGLSGTRCFSSRQEFVGVTDWFLTGQFVFDQFRNMGTEPFLCKVKFTSDPFRPSGVPSNHVFEDGHFGAESLSNGVRNSWDIIVGDYINSYDWKDAGVALSSPGPVDMVKFFIAGESCIKNVMIACNGGAANGLGNVAVSVGNGF